MPQGATVCNVTDTPETRDHARLLREAIVNHDGMTAELLSDLTGVSQRTIGNWTSKKKPTMPSPTDRAKLKRVLGDYLAGAGDPVEAAIRRSTLAPFRQTALIAEYQRHLHEQHREATG